MGETWLMHRKCVPPPVSLGATPGCASTRWRLRWRPPPEPAGRAEMVELHMAWMDAARVETTAGRAAAAEAEEEELLPYLRRSRPPPREDLQV